MREIESPSLRGFEVVSCEICGSSQRQKLASRRDLFLGGEALFTMVQCQNCGVVYQCPRPTPAQMTRYYPEDYQQYTPAVQVQGRPYRFFRRYGLRKRTGMVTRFISHGHLLDVGCATGDFLFEMGMMEDWQVFGLEPSHAALLVARHQVGLDVVEGTLNLAPFPDGHFEAITMWDVLEHVYDPRRVIRQAARLLCSGGLLVINHPNLKSIDRRLFKELWLGYELPRHLHLFPEGLLRQLMTEAGLEQVEQLCLYGSHAATFSSVGYVIDKHMGPGRFSYKIKHLLLSRPVRFLLAPCFKVIDALGLGSNVTVVFRKSA